MDPDSAYAPSVAINEAGGAIVAWRVNRPGATGAASASVFDPSSQTWSAEAALPLTASAFTPVTVGLDDSGQASAYQCLGADGELAGYNPMTATWSANLVPPPDATASCVDTVAMPSSTRLVGLWEPPTGPTATLWAGRYDLFGWTQVVEIDSNSSATIDSRAVSATPDGHAAALWRGYFPTPLLHAARFDPTTQAWSTPLRLDDGLTVAASVDIAAMPSGDVIAVWDDASVHHLGTIWTRRYIAASDTWTAQQGLGSGAALPRIAASAGGTAIAMWTVIQPSTGPSLDDRLVWARYASGVWSAASSFTIGPGGANDPHVAMNAAGEAIAAWTITDASGVPSMWVSRFE
jgi:hypothetical protein